MTASTLIALAAYATFGERAAPEVRFATLTGGTIATSELRGKVVLVNFWATWCASCINETPKLVDTYRRYAPRGYETVAVAVRGDHPEAVRDFARRRALPYIVAVDRSGDIAQRFRGARSTPYSVLIDRHGRIVARYVGEPDWARLHAEVEKLL